MTTCRVSLTVPEDLRTAALAFPHGCAYEEPVADLVTCELDKHPHGDHAALLRELHPQDGGAVWATWSAAGGAEARHMAHCHSRSPAQQDACWLAEGHRGGHTWERYE